MINTTYVLMVGSTFLCACCRQISMCLLSCLRTRTRPTTQCSLNRTPQWRYGDSSDEDHMPMSSCSVPSAPAFLYCESRVPCRILRAIPSPQKSAGDSKGWHIMFSSTKDLGYQPGSAFIEKLIHIGSCSWSSFHFDGLIQEIRNSFVNALRSFLE